MDLAAIVDAAVDVIRPEAEEKASRFEVQSSPDPIALVGDADRLQQVFWNLLSNAIKFTPAGGTIGVSVHVDTQNGEVRVTDNGQGIESGLSSPLVFGIDSSRPTVEKDDARRVSAWGSHSCAKWCRDTAGPWVRRVKVTGTAVASG